MDLSAFIRLAPAYYGLAVLTELNGAFGRSTTRKAVVKEFSFTRRPGTIDEETTNYVEKDYLLDAGIEWLEEQRLVRISRDPFGEALIKLDDDYYRNWDRLLKENPTIANYDSAPSKEDWIRDALASVNNKANELKLDRDQYEKAVTARNALDYYNEPQHSPLSELPDLTDDLDEDETTALILDWFYKNFEDPVHNTPIDDGDYVYIWGGPYEARDIIGNIFSGLTSQYVLDEVVRELDRRSAYWAPNSNRQEPPEPDDDSEDSELPTAETLHGSMVEQVARLEDALDRLPGNDGTPGMGHNNPPETLLPAPLSAEEISELRSALQTLKSQPAEPRDNGVAAQAATEIVAKKEQTIREWFKKKGDMFADEAVKEGGKQFGKWTPPFIYLAILNQMHGLLDIALSWIKLLQFPIF